MKILYLTQFLPLPLDHGGVIKTYSTLKSLKKLGHEIIIFSYITNIKHIKYKNLLEREGFRIGCIIHNENLHNEKPLKKVVMFFKNLISLKPFTVYKFYTDEMKKNINNFLSTEKVDCFWIDHFSMAQFIPQNFTNLKLLETHNIESVFFKLMFLRDHFIHWKIYALHEWIKFCIYEKKYYYKFDKIYTISLNDKSILKKIIIHSNIEVLPPIITPVIKKSKKITSNILIFIGSLCWYPNKDGIYWFLKEVYPLLLNNVDNIKFKIIGKLPRRFIFPFYKGVEFLGYKKSIKKYISDAKLFVVPIRYGSGIRIKILEALSWGIPVITTKSGLDGIPFSNINGIYISNVNKIEFSRKIRLLLESKMLKEKRLFFFKKILKDYYSEKKVMNVLSKFNRIHY